MSEELFRKEIAMKRKDDILRHLATAKALLEICPHNGPYPSEQNIRTLGTVLDWVKDAFWADFMVRD